MAQLIENIINQDIVGYIRKEKLEARLRNIFGYDIRVRVSTLLYLSICGQR